MLLTASCLGQRPLCWETSSSRDVEGSRERTNKAITVCVFLWGHDSNSDLSRQVFLSRQVPNSDSCRRRTWSNESYEIWTERFHTISQPISCRLENHLEGQEWTEYEGIFRESRSHSVVRETKKQDRNPEDLLSKERGTEVKIKDEQQNIMKRQCRILRISAEHNTSVRITDEVSLLKWILHFAVQFLNKLRIWFLHPKVQFGKKIWFQKIGEEGMKDSRNFSWWPRSKENNFVYCQEWRCARPQLDTSDFEWCLGIDDFWKFGLETLGIWWPGRIQWSQKQNWQDVSKWWFQIWSWRRRSQLTKKERHSSCKELWSRNRRRFYVLSTDIEARGHMGSCLGVALLTPQGEATGFRERIGTTILAREARREICKDRVAERERVREMRRARIERSAGDVPAELGCKEDEQVAVRHADASGGHIIENQHKKKRKRDIQVSGAVKASTRPFSTIREPRKARANDLWSRILRWAAQTRRPKEVNERGSEATIK